MSHRPILHKQIRRLEKALYKRPLPENIDLIDWLKMHRYAQTTGAAKRLLLAGKVRVESHIVGRVQAKDPLTGEDVFVLAPVVDARYRSGLWVAK